eukprot:m.280826 g.280826  ORF g.280826 m.280826 type:complete len:69 (-) comp17737_c0_seq3:363-569(-)
MTPLGWMPTTSLMVHWCVEAAGKVADLVASKHGQQRHLACEDRRFAAAVRVMSSQKHPAAREKQTIRG